MILVDGKNLLWRHAATLTPEDLPRTRGDAPECEIKTVLKWVENSGPIQGFLSSLCQLGRDYDDLFPVVVVWEGRDNWRLDLFREYKASREISPFSEDFHLAMRLYLKILRWLLPRIGIYQITPQGGEGDDGFACAISRARAEKFLIYSSDHDLFQLVTDDVSLLRPDRRGDSVLWTPKTFQSEYGFPPGNYRMYLALAGDPGDNVPGVKGIGDKGARELASLYKTPEDLEEAIKEDPESVTSKKLYDQWEKFRLSWELVGLRGDLEFFTDKPLKEDRQSLLDVLRYLGLNKLLTGRKLTVFLA